MEDNREKNRNKIWWVNGIVLLLLCAGLIIYQDRGAIYNEMNALKLIPTPERFTELYFQNSASLPTSTIAGKSISFSFTINNLEGTSTIYPYAVYFQYPNGRILTFKDGVVSLPDNASTTIDVSHTFKTSNLTGQVVVNLPSLDNQQIDFLLPDTNN